MFLFQTTNVFYVSVGINLPALKIHSFLLISLPNWATQKVFPLRPGSINPSMASTSLMKSSREVIHNYCHQ